MTKIPNDAPKGSWSWYMDDAPPVRVAFLRYLCFAGDDYYPCGGVRDLQRSVESLDDAQSWANEQRDSTLTWWHVYDVVEQRVVLEKIP